MHVSDSYTKACSISCTHPSPGQQPRPHTHTSKTKNLGQTPKQKGRMKVEATKLVCSLVL